MSKPEGLSAQILRSHSLAPLGDTPFSGIHARLRNRTVDAGAGVGSDTGMVNFPDWFESPCLRLPLARHCSWAQPRVQRKVLAAAQLEETSSAGHVDEQIPRMGTDHTREHYQGIGREQHVPECLLSCADGARVQPVR